MEIDIEIKAINEEDGTFTAYGSTFGNEDLGGDVVVKGAFQKSLQETPAEKVYMFYNHDTKEITLDFLCEMQTDEGGLRANTRIPIADLLSSFTGGLTLTDLNSFGELDVELFDTFVRSMERAEGGFQAAAWDDAHDVEYSFYGLGCKALLATHE